MLDRSLLLKELDQVARILFEDNSQSVTIALHAWQAIVADSLFAHKVKGWHAPLPVPSWDGQLDEAVSIAPLKKYHVISVDGSQIYPDRHHGVRCYLINVGAVTLHYTAIKPVEFYNVPYVFADTENEQNVELSTELVNGKRQELELSSGVQLADVLQKSLPDAAPMLLLFDGSLIFWHLEAKNNLFKELFFSRYIASLFDLYRKKIPCASYISAPKSRELVNLIKLHLCNGNVANQESYKEVERLVDTTIASFFIAQGERTGVFKNHASISEEYPEVVHPYFFYLHVGTEIGRVEIPAWIAHDVALTDQIASIIYDQCLKGRGYPVALAEAHEQAVVKGPDRDFFYHLIAKMSLERKRKMGFSQKMLKKLGSPV